MCFRYFVVRKAVTVNMRISAAPQYIRPTGGGGSITDRRGLVNAEENDIEHSS